MVPKPAPAYSRVTLWPRLFYENVMISWLIMGLAWDVAQQTFTDVTVEKMMKQCEYKVFNLSKTLHTCS